MDLGDYCCNCIARGSGGESNFSDCLSNFHVLTILQLILNFKIIFENCFMLDMGNNNRPYEAGKWHDITIFCDSLLSHLELMKEWKRTMDTLENTQSLLRAH